MASFEQAIAAKLDHLAELQPHEVQAGQPNMPLGTHWVGHLPRIVPTVLTTISLVCWLVVWLAPAGR